MERSGVWPDIQRATAMLAEPAPDYAALQGLLRDIGNRVMLAERVDAGLRRDAHEQLIVQLMAAVFGILLAGAVLFWQLFFSLQRAKAATEQIALQHAQARELLSALELERSARLRFRDFVSLMSHQLRTPLAVIDSSAQRLVRQSQAPAGEQNISDRSWRIRQSVSQLNQLISRVLEGLWVDEISSGGMPSLDLSRCSWQEIVDETIDRVGDTLDGRRLEVLWARPEQEPIGLECDRMWCMEILGNLLSNAHKYSPPDLPIQILTRLEEGELRCQVRDFGPGIAQADATRLFERFYRGSRSQHVTGLGLGLSIARTLAHWQGGSLTVDNPPGGGAAFMLALPLARPAAPCALQSTG